MRLRSLDDTLRQARIPYTAFSHPPAFTAQREAAASHVPGRSWAKVVVCFADDEVIPYYRADLVANIAAMQRTLSFTPQVTLAQGMAALVEGYLAEAGKA